MQVDSAANLHKQPSGIYFGDNRNAKLDENFNTKAISHATVLIAFFALASVTCTTRTYPENNKKRYKNG